MARNIPLQILRTTRANLETQKSVSGLLAGELYLITDENKLAIGTASNAYIDVSVTGLPVGGRTDQVLIKNSNMDYDTNWTTILGSGSQLFRIHNDVDYGVGLSLVVPVEVETTSRVMCKVLFGGL